MSFFVDNWYTLCHGHKKKCLIIWSSWAYPCWGGPLALLQRELDYDLKVQMHISKCHLWAGLRIKLIQNHCISSQFGNLNVFNHAWEITEIIFSSLQCVNLSKAYFYYLTYLHHQIISFSSLNVVSLGILVSEWSFTQLCNTLTIYEIYRLVTKIEWR